MRRWWWVSVAALCACRDGGESGLDSGASCGDVLTVWYADMDQDGFGDPATARQTCEAPSGHVPDGTDCDDTDPAIFPSAEELCNEQDDDCDGAVDDDLTRSWYADADADGWGRDQDATFGCDPGNGWAPQGGDCDDDDPSVHPQADETCDGVDRDCDGIAQDDTQATWWPDQDFDGYGDADAAEALCEQPEGWVDNGEDCDDSSAGTHPGAEDLCDGEDNDCDGSIDEDHKADWVLVTLDDENVYRVNPSTGQTSIFQPLTDGVVANSADVREDGLALIHSGHNKEIYTLDHCQGRESLVGATGVDRMGGIAFGPGGRLFGLDNAEDRLVSIDIATGLATTIGPLGFDMGNDGMAYDCAKDVLWGLDEDHGLFRIDPGSGLAWDFEKVWIQFAVVGLEYDAGRQLLLAANGPSLYEIDPETGASTRVGDFGLVDDVNDLAFMPSCP